MVDHYISRVRGNLQMLEQLDLIGKTSEMARLFGIQFLHVLTRGSQVGKFLFSFLSLFFFFAHLKILCKCFTSKMFEVICFFELPVWYQLIYIAGWSNVVILFSGKALISLTIPLLIFFLHPTFLAIAVFHGIKKINDCSLREILFMNIVTVIKDTFKGPYNWGSSKESLCLFCFTLLNVACFTSQRLIKKKKKRIWKSI